MITKQHTNARVTNKMVEVKKKKEQKNKKSEREKEAIYKETSSPDPRYVNGNI